MLVINCTAIVVWFQQIFVHLKEKLNYSFFQASFTIHLCQYSGKYPRLSRGRPGFNSPTERKMFFILSYHFWQIGPFKTGIQNQLFRYTQYDFGRWLVFFSFFQNILNSCQILLGQKNIYSKTFIQLYIQAFT